MEFEEYAKSQFLLSRSQLLKQGMDKLVITVV